MCSGKEYYPPSPCRCQAPILEMIMIICISIQIYYTISCSVLLPSSCQITTFLFLDGKIALLWGDTMIYIKLQRLLDKRDMSQRELSRRTGIRIATISMYCNNSIQRLNKADIDKICATLGCKMEDLLEFVPEGIDRKE